MKSIGQLMKPLLIATTTDPASVNICRHLIQKYRFESVSNSGVSSCNLIPDILFSRLKCGNSLYLWIVSESLLELNFSNVKFLDELKRISENHFDEEHFEELAISDILYLSRHSSSSGTPSLTVHPIGIPWYTEEAYEVEKNTEHFPGGKPGKCSPPSFHIGNLYRLLSEKATLRGISENFEITLEATHHGPYVEIPSCFIEIGSTENEWNISEAGELWSDCLADYFGLELIDEDQLNSKSLAKNFYNSEISSEKTCCVILIGGGHYVPKMNDMAKCGENFFLGHSLTNYSLKDSIEHALGNAPDQSRPIQNWKDIIDEAIVSTRITFPSKRLICLVDKKAFKSEAKNMIVDYLQEEKGIICKFKPAEIKKLFN